MAYFPLLQQLNVTDYGLYPGLKDDGKFEIKFEPGLTMILGANGLGKTTLMTMIFRMLTGPTDLQLPEGEIGNVKLVPYSLTRADRRQFAQRVNDGAQSATATLRFALGGVVFEVVRKLEELQLVSLRVNGADLAADEDTYVKEINKHAGVGTFADWLLLLRTLVFFFEDRRALVWDYGAQRQLLRCLLLDAAKAAEWTRQERAILELDSVMRNLSNALKRHEKLENESAKKVVNESAVRKALTVAQKHLARLVVDQQKQIEEVEQSEQLRQSARLAAMRAEAAHDQALRELDRARLLAVEAHLPKAEESVKFIYARLMSDESCLVCGTAGVAKARARLTHALEHDHCVVCESTLPKVSADVKDIGDARISTLRHKVNKAATQWAEKVALRDGSAGRYADASLALAKLSGEIGDAQAKVDNLANQLPPSEHKVKELQAQLRAAQGLVESQRARLRTAREAFAQSINEYREDIQKFAAAIKVEFDKAAAGFLFEDSGLTWAPVRQRIGQAGGDEGWIEYPAFAVELSGSDFEGVQRRDSPEQVSESQREFIDLAFRMALIAVASPQKAATLAIDAPESSLDAVFVDQAADVLAGFANTGENRLIATSNLGAGELVPALLERAATARRPWPSMLIDLFHAGVPTRAMEKCKDSYEKYWQNLKVRLDGAQRV